MGGKCKDYGSCEDCKFGKCIMEYERKIKNIENQNASLKEQIKILESREEETRMLRNLCHKVFDPLWRNAEKPYLHRGVLYTKLAKELNIPKEDCHFGCLDLSNLRKAYKIISCWNNKD